MTKQVYDLEERTFHFAKRVRLYFLLGAVRYKNGLNTCYAIVSFSIHMIFKQVMINIFGHCF